MSYVHDISVEGANSAGNVFLTGKGRTSVLTTTKKHRMGMFLPILTVEKVTGCGAVWVDRTLGLIAGPGRPSGTSNLLKTSRTCLHHVRP